jgi:hypothetical protein
MWLPFLNIFFFIFHTAFTLFNMSGWAFHKTRKWHLLTILLTAASWFILGIWYGWGYCACTDWHWQVREAMGFNDRSNSYIHFLLLKLTGKDFNAALVEKVTLYVFLACAGFSIWLNIRDHRKQIRQ